MTKTEYLELRHFLSIVLELNPKDYNLKEIVEHIRDWQYGVDGNCLSPAAFLAGNYCIEVGRFRRTADKPMRYLYMVNVPDTQTCWLEWIPATNEIVEEREDPYNDA